VKAAQRLQDVASLLSVGRATLYRVLQREVLVSGATKFTRDSLYRSNRQLCLARSLCQYAPVEVRNTIHAIIAHLSGEQKRILKVAAPVTKNV